MATGNLQSSHSQLAAQVRQRLVSQAVVAMDAMLVLVNDRLTSLMDEAAPSREMQQRRDAWMTYQQAKGRWLAGTVKAWQSALVPSAPGATPTGGKGKSLELELLGTEVVENNIIASRLALDLMEKSAKAVNDLRRRLKFLNSEQPLNANDIVHPEVLILSLVEQWEACGLSRESWQLVSSIIGRHLNEQLQHAYSLCNDELVAQNVLPDADFKPVVKHSAYDDAAIGNPGQELPMQAGVHSPGQRGAVGHSPTGPGMMAGGGRYAGPSMAGPAWRSGRSQNVMEQLGSLLSGVLMNAGHFGGVADSGGVMPTGDHAMVGNGGFVQGNGGGVFVGGSGFANPSGLSGASFGDSPMQGGMVGAGPTGYSGPSVPLMVALAQQPPLNTMQFVTAEGGGQVVYPAAISQLAGELRQQSTELKQKAETESEKTIIELVALMFQSILQEDRITPGARVWFARLQMPVLRLALADPDFFNKLDHPARQLIDHMGSCVLGLDSSGVSGDVLETEIKRVVQVIEQYPETGERVYKRVYDEFKTFLKQHLAEKPAAQKVMGVAEKLEQKETLTIQYTIELRDQLKDMPVREEIRSFLFKIWAEVLAVSTVRQGKQHSDTLLLKKTATDLIWAASAKPNRADRAKVIAGLPDLLQCLRNGLALLGLARSVNEAHIKIISDTLADAFMSKTEAIADEQIQALAQCLSALDDFVGEDEGIELPLDTDNIEELLGVETTDLDVVNQGGGTSSQVMMEWARELSLGSWFTLKYKADVTPVQLVWRSPLSHLHLFANNVGHSYLFQSVRLAAYLQDASLEPLEEELLMMRATRNALGEIQANPTLLMS